MKFIRYCLFLVLSTPLSLAAKNLPESVLKQLPLAQYTVLTSAINDFDDNGLEDLVVVLRNRQEPAHPDTHFSRPLLVFMQISPGHYQLNGRNSSVVFAADEGGVGGDPFEVENGEGIAAKGRFFTVENSVAGGIHWTDYITFQYSPTLHQFIFHRRITENWIMNPSQEPDADALILDSHRDAKADPHQPVLLQNYRP